MKRKKEELKAPEALKIVGSHLTTEHRNKFLNSCYKIRDICSNGMPSLKNRSKLLNTLVDYFQSLFSLFRSTPQRQTLFDVVVDHLSDVKAPYNPEIVSLTVCAAILIQFPRRDLRWSDIEMTNLVKSLDRLRHEVFQSFCEMLNSQQFSSEERLAIQWCRGITLYVIRMSVIFCLAKGIYCHEDVWEIHHPQVDGNTESSETDRLRPFLKQQKRLYKAVLHKSIRSKKTCLYPRPLLEVLKSLGSDQSKLHDGNVRKRRCHFDLDNDCYFEINEKTIDVDSETSPKKIALAETPRFTTDNLLTIMHSVDNKESLALKLKDENELRDFLNCLILLKERQQALSSTVQSKFLERIVWICQSSSLIITSSFLSNSRVRKAQLHQHLLDLWLFLMQRKRIVTLLPNGHLHFTCLLTPDYSQFDFDEFIAVGSAIITFMLRYLALFRTRVLCAPFLFLEASRIIWAEVLRRAEVTTNSPIPPADCSKLCAIGLSLNTFVNCLCEGENRVEVSRVARLLLEEHFLQCQNVTPHTDVKRCLQQIIFLLFDVVDPFALEQMKLDLKLGPRELLKRALQDFRARSKKEKSKAS